MKLSRDLLEQARHLCGREPRRPRQASLRRAVSAAYYAAFHLLVDDGARILASGTGDANIRAMLTRCFTHEEMKSVCQEIANARWPHRAQSHAGALTIPQELQDIAGTFVQLQQYRHRADYDTVQSYKRSQVSDYLDATESLFEDWRRVRSQPAAKMFLAILFAFRKIKG